MEAFQRELVEQARAHGTAYRRKTILALMMGIFPIIMSATVINVAIPEIQSFFSAGHLAAQVLASAFLASMTASMLLSGGVIGRLGVRVAFRWVNLGFVLASLSVLLMGGGGFAWLVLARIVQGALAGIAQSLALIVIMSVFPPEQRGRAISIYGLGIVLSPTIGPVLGGALTTAFGWQSIFLFSLPFSLLSMALGDRRLPVAAPADLPRRIRAAPVAYLVLFVGGLAAAFLLWLREPVAGWILAAVSASGFALFILDQSRASLQMLNFRLLQRSGVAAACLVSFAYGAGLYGSTYLIPVYIRLVGQHSSWEAGMALLPSGIVLAGTLYLAGSLTDRLSAASVLFAGLLAFTLSNAAFLLTLTPVNLVWVIGYTIIGRIGLGLTIPSLNAGATRLAPETYASTVAVLVNYFRQLGGTVGVGAVGLLLERTAGSGGAGPGADPAAFGQAFMAMALCFVPAMIATRWMTGERLHH